MRVLALAAVAVLAIVTPAWCQQIGVAPAAANDNGYIAALAGVSYESETNAVFGIEYVDNLGKVAQAYATFTYFDNLLGRTMRDDLVDLGRALTSTTGTPWVFDGRDRAMSFTVGGKARVPGTSLAAPYIGLGAGGIRIKRTVTEQTRGDVTGAVLQTLGISDDAVDIRSVSTVRPLAEVSVGIGMTVHQTYIDLGYRFRRIFHTQESFDFSQFGVAVGFAF